MRKIEDWKTLKINPHNIVVASTSAPDYEMSRKILLSYDYKSYILLEGWHCSCYDFNETEWEAIEYTNDEITKLANAPYNEDSMFWKQVKEQVV